jgi:hypothetical protein
MNVNFCNMTHQTTRIFLTIMLLLAGITGSYAQFPIEIKKITDQVSGGGKLTEKDAAAGIREALIKGTGEGVKIVSQVNGYFGNPQIRIPFPENAREIESKLRAIGLGSQVDEVVESVNRAAEDAAKSAEQVFVSAITAMTIADAINIVKGTNDAATRYLERTTTPELKAKFTPIVKASLDRVNATKLWADVVNSYNQIPFIKKQNPDLVGYVTDKAIAGLFVMVAKEEAKIRKDPMARTTELLKKVFGM